MGAASDIPDLADAKRGSIVHRFWQNMEMEESAAVEHLRERREAQIDAFSDAGDRALEYLTQIDDFFTAFNDNIAAASVTTKGRYVAMTNVLIATDKTVERRVEMARENLGRIREKVGELDRQFQSDFDEMQRQLKGFKNAIAEILGAIESEMDRMNFDSEELGRRVKAAETDAETTGETVGVTAGEFYDAIGQLQASLTAEKDGLIQNFIDLRADIEKKLVNIGFDFDLLCQEIVEKESEAGRISELTSNRIATALARTLTEEINGEFLRDAKTLTVALETLETVGTRGAKDLEVGFDEIVKNIDRVIGRMEAIADNLEMNDHD